ncbi:MAG: LPS-assembly protein LptD [Nitrospinaceae bacterium]|nr:MAG: LPS-assembly protein LptD [Nitrospinaceae bacterium]
MKQLLRIILLVWIAAVPVNSGFAQVKSKPQPDFVPNDVQEVRISADHMSQDKKSDTVRAWGNVVIQLEDRVLRADKVKISNKTGVGEARGNVMLTSQDGTVIKSERSLFNINSQRGKAFGVIGKINAIDKQTDSAEIPITYFFKGKEIKRYSPVRYKLKDAYLTTCRGKVPDWSFKAKKMDIIQNDRALFTRGVFKVKDIPILYLPIGYLPLNKDRKTGFLMPKIGTSNIDGITFEPIFFWAINDQSDATVSVKYLEKRGVQPKLEYRYNPHKDTEGQFNGTFLNDRTTGGTFYKIDWKHDQLLEKKARLKAKLDLESASSFNKTFEDNTNLRTRRNSDSFASLNKSWSNSTLDTLIRFRDSTEETRDDLFAQLPQVTFQHQRQQVGKSSFFFNQETSYTSFLLDLNTDPDNDNTFNVHRFDFHPQISRPIAIAPWLALTPTIGWRETLYTQGLKPNSLDDRVGTFSRELFDASAALEGPKIDRIFVGKGKNPTKIKHLIEPRISYSFIPDMDLKDRDQIRRIDGVDAIESTSKFTYSLTQRLLKKKGDSKGNSQANEILRFVVSQSYDLRKSVRGNSIDTNPRDREDEPFSDLRFDFDSRLFEPFMFNIDSTFDIYDNQVETLNFEFGVKPLDTVSFFVERRFIRNQSTFLLGSLYWDFKKSWQVQATTRFDELTETFRENDVSLVYDNPCKCWGFALDFISRDLIAGSVNKRENKFLFTLTLRGVGTEGVGDKFINHIHRQF